MQQVAVGWLVYRLTNSPLLLGISSFAALFPTFFLSPLAGAFSDKVSRQKILIATQTLFLFQALLLFVLNISGIIHIWHIIALNTLLGILNGFDAPVRQSFVVEMVENKEDLGNAIALNSLMFNSARLIGPSVAGLIVAGFGESVCFLINAVSYTGVIIALYSMKITPKKKVEAKETGLLKSIKEGFIYTWNFAPVRSLLIMIAVISLFGTPYMVLMPIYAKTILNGGAHTMGFLMGGIGFGALIGALMLASRKNLIGLPKIIAINALVFSITLVGFSISQNYAVSQILVIIAGYSIMSQTASSNTIIQTIIDDNMRGRVMSFYTMSFMGTMPVGSLLIGGFAESFGAPAALMAGGIICLMASLWLILIIPKINLTINSVYEKNGIYGKTK